MIAPGRPALKTDTTPELQHSTRVSYAAGVPVFGALPVGFPGWGSLGTAIAAE
jgi:hypothetical protein